MPAIDYVLEIETNSSGAATVTGDSTINGMLLEVEWVDGSLVDGVDAVISLTKRPSGAPDQTLLTLTDANSDAVYPLRDSACDNTGADISGSSVLMTIVGTPKVVVSSGGDTKTGKVILRYLRF